MCYDEIARDADVGVGTGYRRFPTRGALFLELFHVRVDAVVGIAEETLSVEDPWLGLGQFMRRNFELQSSDRRLCGFLLGRADPRQPHPAIDAGKRHPRAGRGAKRRQSSQVHAAGDPLGHWLALRVTAADEVDE